LRGTALHAARRGTGPVAHWQRLAAEGSGWDSAATLAPLAPAVGPTYWPVAAPANGITHPFADNARSEALHRQDEDIEAAFAAIEPVLVRIAPRHFDEGFPELASRELRALGIDVPPRVFAAHVMAPLNMRFLHARCVIGTFCRFLQKGFDRSAAERSDGESAKTLIEQWGFHAIDVTPCADGRLSGVVDHILRIPPSVVTANKSYAGALFNITESLRQWESVELRRFRDGKPNAANAPTRFLKMAVYHFSSVDPHHHGCAAHGSDTARAAGAALERLGQFEGAVRGVHGPSAGVATLLVGVDTDTDAIRVHVPDASGRMSVSRYVDSNALYGATIALPREAGKTAVRRAVAESAGVAEDDKLTEGMRWFCGYLLKNNIAQVDHVRQAHGGAYSDAGHTEKLVVVGDGVDDVQMRNLCFQAQMETVEEGGADLDIGISILRKTHEPRGLAVPVLVHFRHDPRLPGSAARAEFKTRRLMSAIIARHAGLASRKKLFVQGALRAADGSGLVVLDPSPEALEKLEAYA